MGSTSELRVGCCIAGGGPAGMMLGFLLARAGVPVAVLEKHADFFRDFRGDTIHPSTLNVIAELGLLDAFLALPHQEVRQLGGRVGGETIPIADLRHLPTRCKFLALMPQWDFLNFLAEQGRRYPGFRLLMETNAQGLVQEGDRVVGVRATAPSGPLTVRADLVVAADGRHSTLRAAAQLDVVDLGAPMDVLWMRIPRRPGDPTQAFGTIDTGTIFVLIDRTDYYQGGLVIAKGGYDEIRAQGIEALRRRLEALAPFLRGRLDDTLRSFDDVSLLTVKVDRLREWYRPGMLCIGDAAHAMSPIGGVGINLAIQDAVATANRLAAPLRAGSVGLDDLRAVQRRRELPTRLTQWLQVTIQKRIISRVLSSTKPVTPPWPVRLFRTIPYLQRIPARIIGIGFRPEHVHTSQA